MTRAGLADAISKSYTGRAKKLFCDEERIRRWEAGEVLGLQRSIGKPSKR